MATQVALDAVAQVFGTSGIDVAEYGDHDRGIAEGRALMKPSSLRDEVRRRTAPGWSLQ